MALSSNHTPDISEGKYKYPRIPSEIIEAFEYSPLASVVSLEPLLQTIPQLKANPCAESVLKLSDGEKKMLDMLLESNNGTGADQKGEMPSSILQEIMGSLKGIQMSKWSFKVPGKIERYGTEKHMESSKLDAFSRILVDKCTVDIIYPSPVTPTAHTTRSKEGIVKDKEGCIEKTVIESDMEEIVEENVEKEPIPVQPLTPQSNIAPCTPISKNNTRKIQVSGGFTDKSKRFSDIIEKEGYCVVVDDQLKEEKAVDQLEKLIRFIFEAEEAMESDPTYLKVEESYMSCWCHGTVPFEGLCLNMEMLSKLDFCIRKVCIMGLINTLPVDLLLRFEKICARSIDESQVITLTKQSFETNSYEENLSIITKIGTSLYSIIILMRILTSEQLSKQLYSEEILIDMAYFLKSTLDNVIYVLIDCNKNSLYYLFLCLFILVDVSKKSDVLKFKKSLNMIFYNVISIMEYFFHLIRLIEIPDGVVTRLEFLSIPAIFVENSVSIKDQLFNSQAVEALKVASMDMIQLIYAKYPDQRTFILDEILTSLVKLPINKHQARRYKLIDGKSIQLISALIMKLVQSCATSYKSDKGINIYEFLEKDVNDMKKDIDHTLNTKSNASDLLEMIFNTSSQFMDSATANANHVVSFLLSKAMKISKITNDFSHKILLDILIEDLLLVLPLPSWPSSELLLKLIVTKLLNYLDNDKESSHIKGLSLDFLGIIASKIRLFFKNSIDFSNYLSKSDVLPSSISSILQTGIFFFEKLDDLKDLFKLHLLIMESLDLKNIEESKDKNIIQYLWLRWIYFIRSLKQKYTLNNSAVSDDYASEILKLCIRILLIWFNSDNSENDSLTDQTYRLYLLNLSIYSIYQLFDAILSRILRCLDSNQISIRTKALRSLGLIVNNDSSILSNTGVRQHVAARIADISSQVRDIAIDLVGKYAIFQKEIGQQYYSVLSERIADTGLSVRKRVIKFLKDFYIISDTQEIQVDIGRRLIQRLCDNEDSIKDLSAKTIEDIWFSVPDDQNEGNIASIKFKKIQTEKILILQSIIETLPDEDRFSFKVFLQKISKSKNMDSSNFILTSSISLMFDILLEYHQNQDMRMLEKCLNTIVIFAEACPKSFSSDQLMSIQPYLNGLNSSQEQVIFFYTVIIYRNVLPYIPSMPKNFLNDLQKMLLSQLTKLPAKILNEVVPCLSVLANLFGDYERVGKIISSCIKAIEPYKTILQNKKQISDDKKLILLLLLLGLFGRHCDLDNHFQDLNVFLKLKPDTSIAKFLINTISIFCSLSSDIHISVQKVALHSIGIICISHSKFFLCDQTLEIMSNVFQGTSIELQNTLLLVFYDFLSLEEKGFKVFEKNNHSMKKEIDNVNILTGEAKKFENDGASISLIQRYLPQILEISLNEDTTLSITAVKILEIITSNGIANPRTCIPTIIALQASPNKFIKDMATKMHLEIHEKYESLIEGCYIDGIKMAFQYQIRMKYDSNLLFIFPYNIIRQNRQSRKKFLISLTKMLDIDMLQINSHDNILFSKFLVQNMASFEYNTIEEIQYIIYIADRILSTTGITLHQRIETEEFKFQDHDIIKVTIASVQMLALVLLKKYLKESYGLTEQKCRSFDPNKTGNSKDTKPLTKLRDVSLNLDHIPNITDSMITRGIAEKIIQNFYDVISNDDISYTEFIETNEHRQTEENETETYNDDNNDNDDEIDQLAEIKKKNRKKSKRKEKSFKNGISKKKYKQDISDSD
ncbi:hypothetical protein T552_02311 [Pneumocystis carinii B80]|uniref:Sister chromatid cohesion protein n=1 Tax=Pneumocystis carinii (strain B80) TaxID=1408658 RepID=A0A0W4ZG24_PNEC8|nr:hypothetical protein T552_02311 [Pneumocystis carinii B80]KTW27327.1 hypothetical protein T552_02311 [Pneumocystis carinii B80]